MKTHMTYEQKMALSMDEAWKRSVEQEERNIANTSARLALPNNTPSFKIELIELILTDFY